MFFPQLSVRQLSIAGIGRSERRPGSCLGSPQHARYLQATIADTQLSCTAATHTARPCMARLRNIRCTVPAGSSGRRHPRPTSHHGTAVGAIATLPRRNCALRVILCPSTSPNTWRTRTPRRLAIFPGSTIAAARTTAIAVAAAEAAIATAVAAAADAIVAVGRTPSRIRVRLPAPHLHAAVRPGNRASFRLPHAGLGVALSLSVLRSPL